MERPDLTELLEIWQERLRLRDWRVEAMYMPREKLETRKGYIYGMCFPDCDAMQATIWMRDPNDWGEDIPEEPIERTLIHELCHLFFPDGRTATEQIVNRIAEALYEGYATRRKPRATRKRAHAARRKRK